MTTTKTPKKTKAAPKPPAAPRKKPKPLPTIHVGARLRTARVRAGLSQEQLAEKLGTKQSIVSAWERRQNVTPPTVNRVAKALGVSAEAIYQLEEAS